MKIGSQTKINVNMIISKMITRGALTGVCDIEILPNLRGFGFQGSQILRKNDKDSASLIFLQNLKKELQILKNSPFTMFLNRSFCF